MDHIRLPDGDTSKIHVVYAPILFRKKALQDPIRFSSFDSYWRMYSPMFLNNHKSETRMVFWYWDLPEVLGFDRIRLLRGDFEEREPEETLAFLTDWLYFGMLEKVTGLRVNIENHLTTLKNPSGQGDDIVVLSTMKLLGILKQWWRDRFEDGSTEKLRQNRMMNSFLAVVRNLVTHYAESFARLCPPYGEQLHFALAILGELLQETKGRIWDNYKAYSTGPTGQFAKVFAAENPGDDFLGEVRWGPSSLVRRSMLELGWCKAEVSRLETILPVVGVYYASFLRKRQDLSKHQSCSNENCEVTILNQPDLYKQKHLETCSGCIDVVSPIEDVSKIIENGGIPVMKVSRSPNNLSISPGFAEDLILEVVDAKSYVGKRQPKYVAISHVWVDGLGHEHGNSIPMCQLEQIKAYIKSLIRSANALDRLIYGAPYLFWMDTLCIPRTQADKQREKMFKEDRKKFDGLSSWPCHLSPWDQMAYRCTECHSAKYSMREHDNRLDASTRLEDDVKRFKFLRANAKTRGLRDRAIEQMAEIYSGAWRVLVIDAELRSLHSKMNSEELSMRVICSGWMRRLWTLQEAILGAQDEKVYVQCSDRAMSVYDAFIDLADQNKHEEIMTIYNNSSEPVPYEENKGNRYFDFETYVRNPVDCHMRRYWEYVWAIHEGENAHAYKFTHVWNETRWRSASHEGDRAFVIGTLLGVDTMKLLGAGDGDAERLEVMYSLLRSVPANILFLSGPRLRKYGMGWAPSKFSKTERVNYATDGAGVVTERGLEVFLEGWVLEERYDQGPLHLDNNSQFKVLTEEGTYVATVICPASEQERLTLPRSGSRHAIILRNGNEMEIDHLPEDVDTFRKAILVEIEEITTRYKKRDPVVVGRYCCQLDLTEFDGGPTWEVDVISSDHDLENWAGTECAPLMFRGELWRNDDLEDGEDSDASENGDSDVEASRTSSPFRVRGANFRWWCIS